MYTKPATAGVLALTPGVTFANTGSVVLAGLSLVVVGIGALLLTRSRRKHDDNVLDK